MMIGTMVVSSQPAASEQLAGNGSEWVAGSESEYLAGSVGIRTMFINIR
ncbi:MAG: hypothetical protein WCF85_17460 [Rhodospirillaceae bacterium]